MKKTGVVDDVEGLDLRAAKDERDAVLAVGLRPCSGPVHFPVRCQFSFQGLPLTVPVAGVTGSNLLFRQTCLFTRVPRGKCPVDNCIDRFRDQVNTPIRHHEVGALWMITAKILKMSDRRIGNMITRSNVTGKWLVGMCIDPHPADRPQRDVPLAHHERVAQAVQDFCQTGTAVVVEQASSSRWEFIDFRISEDSGVVAFRCANELIMILITVQ